MAVETRDAAYWVRALGLRPHPEGGYFREVYRSAESIPAGALPPRYEGARPFATCIYYLLPGDAVSAFHRLKSDEIWHFLDGSALTVHMLDDAGRHTRLRLGRDPEQGQALLAVVPAGTWFGVRVDDASGYSLVGCTVAPGFEFADFELGERGRLAALYPAERKTIAELTWGDRQA